MRRKRLLRVLLVLVVLLIAAPVVLYLGVLGGSTPSGACKQPATGAVQPGTEARVVTPGGRERCYLLHVPPKYGPAKPAALIISLHGFASSAEDQQYRDQWEKVADVETFLVAYPIGSGLPLRWNTDPVFHISSIDDVRFMRDLIDDVASHAALDPARIYMTGFSNGAGMAEIVACEMADRIAALGVVSGFGPQPAGGCHPSRPVPIMGFFGTGDPVLSYGGSTEVSPVVAWLLDIGTEQRMPFGSFEEWVQGWVQRNQCGTQPRDIPASGDASGTRYTGCKKDAEVVIYKIEGGGHAWPGGGAYAILGKVSTDISASQTLWEFFKAHPLPEAGS